MAKTSIVITAPSSAKKGAAVPSTVTVKNISQYNYSFRGTIYVLPDLYPEYAVGSIDQIITSGASVVVNTSFLMPDCGVTIFIWLEFWSFDHWEYDNSASKVVSLEAAVPEYKGSIARKELEYDSVRGAIPVY